MLEANNKINENKINSLKNNNENQILVYEKKYVILK